MEDEYQSTLKGKIKILYQLEKWQDVVKLCESYNEKYGKDVEIDMMRFKSERHMGMTAPAKKARPWTQLLAPPESLNHWSIPDARKKSRPVTDRGSRGGAKPAGLVLDESPPQTNRDL